MTPQEVLERLFIPITKARVEKAKGLALRQRMDWQSVLDLMSAEQRKQVEEAT